MVEPTGERSWQEAVLDEAVSIIVDGGSWGRGNSMDTGKLGGAVIWANREIKRLSRELKECAKQLAVHELEKRNASMRGCNRAPAPAAIGWLTEEERKAVDHARTALKTLARQFHNGLDTHAAEVCEQSEKILLSLLAKLRDRVSAPETSPAASGAMTPEEREAIELSLLLEWPLTAEQWHALARCLGPMCQVPANKHKVAIRAFLARQPGPEVKGGGL